MRGPRTRSPAPTRRGPRLMLAPSARAEGPRRSPATAAVPQHAFDVFASAACDGVVALWDLRSPAAAARFSSHQNRRDPVQLAFSPCCRFLACGSEDRLAYVYDLRAGSPVARLKGARDTVSAVAWNPLYPQLVTASFDGSLRFYTCKT